MSSLEFKMCQGVIASVKVNLSNGLSSPCFESKSATAFQHEQKISFDEGRKAMRIQAYDASNKDPQNKFTKCYAIWFSKKYGMELASYNPWGYGGFDKTGVI